MNLEAVYFISQILAAMGIMGSLIFVGIQMRQTRDAQRQQAEESRYQTMSQIMAEYRNVLRMLVTDENLGNAYLKSAEAGIGDLDGLDRLRVLAFLSLTIRTFEQAYLHHKAGRLDDEASEAFSGMLQTNISHKGLEDYFAMRKSIFSSSFVEYFEGLIAEQDDLNTAVWERDPGEIQKETDTQ